MRIGFVGCGAIGSCYASYLLSKHEVCVLDTYEPVIEAIKKNAGLHTDIVSDVFDAANLPAIGISIKNPIVTQTNEFYFRVCFVDAFQGISAAHYVHDYLRQNDAVCFKQTGDDYADTMIEQFRQRMDRLTAGAGTVTVLEYPEGTEDFSVYLKRVGATGCKAVFFPCASSIGYKVLYQAAPMGLRWIGCAKWEDLQETARAGIEGGDVAFLNGVTFVKGFDAASSVTPMTDVFKSAYAEFGSTNATCRIVYLVARNT